MLSAAWSGVVQMRIDGVLHPVPIHGVPVDKCETCEIALIHSGTDESIQYFYKKYMDTKGLNTRRHKFVRFCRRMCRKVEWWFYNRPYWHRAQMRLKQIKDIA